jgi:hypothetical protein
VSEYDREPRYSVSPGCVETVGQWEEQGTDGAVQSIRKVTGCVTATVVVAASVV